MSPISPRSVRPPFATIEGFRWFTTVLSKGWQSEIEWCCSYTIRSSKEEGVFKKKSFKILSLAGNYTKIVPGHGPLGNKADLTKFRDMLITSRERVQKLKSAGKSAQEAVAEKPFADLDPV